MKYISTVLLQNKTLPNNCPLRSRQPQFLYPLFFLWIPTNKNTTDNILVIKSAKEKKLK